MRVEYNPSKNALDLTKPNRFYNQYQKPLGRGRRSVHLNNNAVLLTADRAGLMSLVARFLDIGLGRLKSHTLEEVEEWGDGKWYGDLEPGSPGLTIQREGGALSLPKGFVYEAPPFEPRSIIRLEPVKLSAGVEGNVRETYSLFLIVDAASLITLAKHMIYLSQLGVPVGESFIYKSSSQGETKISSLKLEVNMFPQEVPWARVPDPTRHTASQ